jgi:hypothetical protein
MQHLWLFPFLCALLDRAWGGGLKLSVAGHGLGKPLSLLMFPAALFCGFTWPGALALTIAWVCWRSPSWHTFGGDLAPHRERYVGTFLRHCLAPAAFILAGCFILQRLEPTQLYYLIFPGVATVLAIWMRFKSNAGVDVGGTVELIRGAILGALIWAVWAQ